MEENFHFLCVELTVAEKWTKTAQINNIWVGWKRSVHILKRSIPTKPILCVLLSYWIVHIVIVGLLRGTYKVFIV